MQAIMSHPETMKLTAVCDLNESLFRDVPESVETFTDFDRFIDEADVEAVMLAVPHDLHMPQAIRALNAGKHVLVEKPMARTSEECQAMIDAADRNKRTLMVGQNWRYTPWSIAIKRSLDELGSVRAVRTEWIQNIDMHKGGWLKDGIIAGGGPVISLAVHNLDFLRFLFGEVEEVYAAGVFDEPGFTNGAESWAMAQMKFENETTAHMLTSYAAYAPADAGQFSFYGEKGTIHLRADNGDMVPWIASESRNPGVAAHAVRNYEKLDVETVAPDILPNYRDNMFSHFIACCREGMEPISGAKDNIHTIRLVEAIYESMRSGRTVRLKSMQSNDSVGPKSGEGRD